MFRSFIIVNLKIKVSRKIFSLFFIILFISPLGNIKAQDYWQPTNGPYGGIVYDIEVSPNGNIYAATDSGLFLTTDFGENWFDLYLPTHLNVPTVRIIVVNSNDDVFAGFGQLYRSNDNAVSWQEMLGITGGTVTALNITLDDHIFVGYAGHLGGGSFFSTDSGESWESIGLHYFNPRVFAFEYPGYIFAGSTLSGVSRSLDLVSGWEPVNNGLSYHSVTSLVINSSNNIFSGTEGGVYRSTNDGDSWTPINDGLTNLSILSLAINSQDQLFAGTHNGIFIFNEKGTKWVSRNAGLTDTVIYSIAIDSGGYIYVGSGNGLVYRSIQPTTSINSLNNRHYSSFLLEQNYPNPFNSLTSFSFSIPSTQFVKLSVYNIRGVKITDLCNDQYNPGVHSIQWDGKNVPSGIYLIRLEVGQKILTKKAILIK